MVATFEKSAVVLLVGRDEAGTDTIRQALTDPLGLYRLQSIKHLPTALARLAGGGVDLILFDLPDLPTEGSGLEGLVQLHAAAAETPIVVLYGSHDKNLAEQAVRAGAADSLTRDACQTDLRRVAGVALERRRATVSPVAGADSVPRKSGRVIACMGTKGGAGATTVGLNLAAALARDWNVILAELRPTFGSLSQYCRPLRVARDLGHLLKGSPAAIGRAEAEACLWTYRSAPQLKILFGPQTMEGVALSPQHARAVSVALSTLADYVVLDLAVSLAETNRTIIQEADGLILVLERDPIAVQSAKLILRTMETWDKVPLTGVVVVNRAALATPMDIADLESQLSVPLFGLIPPAPDLCAFAQNAHTPLLLHEPESLAAASLRAVADQLKTWIPINLAQRNASVN